MHTMTKPSSPTKTMVISRTHAAGRLLMKKMRLIALGLLPLGLAIEPCMLAVADTTKQGWELRIIHASDQEAGKKALLDIPGMVAVMDELDKLPFPNTLKLTSGDLFIAGPFMNASQVLYSEPSIYTNLKPSQRNMEPLAMRAGIADMIINSNLGWQAAVIGNHEVDGVSQSKGILNAGNFFQLIGADPKLRNYNGKGIGKDAKPYTQPGAGLGDKGYRGATFPYLSVNIDFNSFKANSNGDSIFKAYGLKDATRAPQPAGANMLGRATIIQVGNSPVGVIGATTPFLPDIVGGLEPRNMLKDSYRPKEASAKEQAAALRPLISREVDALNKLGINKIILMTHLQDTAVEEELSQQLVDNGIAVDVVIGGGSHKVMGPADGAKRGLLRGLDQSSVIDQAAKARQQVLPALIPYPKTFIGNNQSRLEYVNGGSNYEYLNQLVVRFDAAGKIIDYDKVNSRPWKTDHQGVRTLLRKPEWQKLSINEQNQKIKEHVLTTSKNANYRNAIATVNAVNNYIDNLDKVQYGLSKVWLNGINADVRSRETNLGNLVADSLLWYAQELIKGGKTSMRSVDIAFTNGGGIRDMIGTEQVMPDESVHRDPPEANPSLDKQQGEISKLDVLNSLRFDNTLSIGTISVAQLKRSVEAMVGETRHGGFGQISGFRFRYDPRRPKGERVVDIDLTKPRRLNDGRVDGRTQQQDVGRPLVRAGKVLDPKAQLGLVTITYLAEGGDGQSGAQLSQHFDNVHWIGEAGEPNVWRELGRPQPVTLQEQDAPASIKAGLSSRELGFGSYRDALGAYLRANHGQKDNPLMAADALSDPAVKPTRIVPIQDPRSSK